MKRKDVEDDIIDDFPLSPAVKIRRLDGEQLWLKPPMVSEDNIASSNTDPVEIPSEVMVELNPVQENDERAIVLFKPLTTPLFQSPSSFRVSIDPDFLSEIKYNQFMSRKQEERDDQVSRHNNTNQCLAVVPWMPSQIPSASSSSSHHEVEISELMMEEDEQMGEEAATMDIDDEDSSIVETGQTQMNENLHCMIEQAHNSSTPPPLVWFR